MGYSVPRVATSRLNADTKPSVYVNVKVGTTGLRRAVRLIGTNKCQGGCQAVGSS